MMSGKTTSDKLVRKGFGLKEEIAGEVAQDYHSTLIDYIKGADYSVKFGGTTIHLAREFGFCYGVDRSIDYAYQTVRKFPDKKIYLTGEIIHNPFVNNRLIEMGVSFLSGQYHKGETLKDIRSEDIVILPAFGVSIPALKQLREMDCILVDTTCGSVLNVWKHIERFTKENYTALVHGKYYHEETIATVSRSTAQNGGHYIIVRDKDEAQKVCDYIRQPKNKGGLLEYFAKCISKGFDPDQQLQKMGVANQTTMLSTESLKIGMMIKEALSDRYGAEQIDDHYRAFDTICSATQDRQDAIIGMLKNKADLSVVIGGFNSSNTMSLTNIALTYCPAYHIEDARDLIDPSNIRHKPVGQEPKTEKRIWLPNGDLSIAVTAGASTPNAKIGEVIEKLLLLCGETIDIEDLKPISSG
jgi:4-hydroxy-3-methylbut-2-enyl diphosphate reductase